MHIWTYGIQLWGTSSNSNIETIERFQNKTLRNLVHAPWFVPNEYIRNDLNIPSVKQEVINIHKNYKERLTLHPNALPVELLHTTLRNSRLKKYKCLM